MPVPQPLDGVTPPAPAPEPVPEPAVEPETAPKPQPPVRPVVAPEVRRLKQVVLLFGILGVIAYLFWGILLLALLPDPNGGLQSLVVAGVASLAAGVLGFGAALLIGFLRIRANVTATVRARKLALFKLIGVTVPMALFGIVAAFMISMEPTLTVDVVSPTKAQDFVAPLPVTFSVERAVTALQAYGFEPLQYTWDIRGDGKSLEKTVVPRLTTSYDKEGVYSVSVTIQGTDGAIRRASKRLVIQRSVFAVTPNPVVINRPVSLSLSNLLPDPRQLTQAEWDTDGDGQVDIVSKDPQVSETYYQLGPVTVTVVVKLANKTQARYERTFDVVEPQPLPFPVTMNAEPKRLIGTPPFGVLFTIDTDEPVTNIQWNFGDNSRGEGDRVAHTFTSKGSFPVVARVRSASGSLAELTTVVRVVDPLQLPDLTFEGTKIAGGRITGELPLKINVTPKTKEPFVTFSWEVPDEVEVASTENTLNAIYREAGTYSITLIGENAENKVLRMPITVEVLPPSSLLGFTMEPESGVAPLTIRLDATQTVIPDKTITGFEWEFGDKSEPEFGSARVEHEFEKAGTYTVQLTVRTTDGKEYVTDKTIVVLPPVLKACILPSRTSGRAPLGIKFGAGCSVGEPQSMLWDFGDGSQTDETDPVHVFEEPGEYTVTLTFTDAEGNEQSASVDISATAP